MTAIEAPTTTLAVTPAAAPRRSLLTSAGGIALLATPLLLAGGMVSIPPGEDGTEAGYVASLAATPWLTALSAGLLHYSWVFFALGVLATPALARDRGRGVVAVVAAVMSFCAIQISGLLLGDWYAMAIGRAVPRDQAAVIFDAANADLWTSTWLWSGKVVGFAGVLLVTAALAYARSLSWWWIVAPLAGFGAAGALGAVLGNVGIGLGFVLSMAPLFVIGAKLVRQRS